MSTPAGPAASRARPSRRWRVLLDTTLVATFALMLVGALTRATMAGVACPDWPLCHGHVVPPLDGAAYPGGYRVYDVYLEFTHRVLAAVAGGGALAVAAHAWRRGLRGAAAALLATLTAQVVAGAVTVWLGNAPWTVVLHLALGLSFLATLLFLRGSAPFAPVAAAPRPGGARVLYGTAAALTVAQLLVGASVSSQLFGLGCPSFPVCEPDRLWPATWSEPAAWQMLHRGLGALLVVVVGGAVVATFVRPAAGRDRRFAVALGAGLLGQALLGGVNVWLRIPPWASALHLGVAVALFAALAWRLVEASNAARASSARIRPA